MLLFFSFPSTHILICIFTVYYTWRELLWSWNVIAAACTIFTSPVGSGKCFTFPLSGFPDLPTTIDFEWWITSRRSSDYHCWYLVILRIVVPTSSDTFLLSSTYLFNVFSFGKQSCMLTLSPLHFPTFFSSSDHIGMFGSSRNTLFYLFLMM